MSRMFAAFIKWLGKCGFDDTRFIEDNAPPDYRTDGYYKIVEREVTPWLIVEDETKWVST